MHVNKKLDKDNNKSNSKAFYPKLLGMQNQEYHIKRVHISCLTDSLNLYNIIAVKH